MITRVDSADRSRGTTSSNRTAYLLNPTYQMWIKEAENAIAGLLLFTLTFDPVVRRTNIMKGNQKGQKVSNGEGTLTRRRALRAVGGSAVVGLGAAAMTGSAGATGHDDAEIVFCGCSQVCWCVEFCNIVEVITEEESIFFSDGETDPPLTDPVGYETENCFEIGDELTIVEDGEPTGETLEYDGEKILAVTVHETDGSGNFTTETTTYCNPHRCADRSIETLGIDCDVTDEGQMARNVRGGCGVPPCEHPADRSCET